MRPAFSVVFLTTLIGAGQGLFLALFAGQLGARAALVPFSPPAAFYAAGAVVALGLAGLGLFASFFHLGRPERAWRSAARWRTSWLSREVIALPFFMAATAAYGAAHALESGAATALGLLALAACLTLFLCTAMIYASVKFLQEWASAFTVVNFTLMGTASGFTLAIALAGEFAPALVQPYAIAAALLTLAALATRLASLARNARLRPRSTLQSAIGIRHDRIAQNSQGFTAGSFNTHEFFHGASPLAMRTIRISFLLLGFLVPLALIAAGLKTGSGSIFAAAFAVQYAGFLAERWFFLAQANHPQNLYYQSVS